MTEKDAIKCTHFASNNHWFVPIQAQLPDAFSDNLLALIKQKNG